MVIEIFLNKMRRCRGFRPMYFLGKHLFKKKKNFWANMLRINQPFYLWRLCFFSGCDFSFLIALVFLGSS